MHAFVYGLDEIKLAEVLQEIIVQLLQEQLVVLVALLDRISHFLKGRSIVLHEVDENGQSLQRHKLQFKLRQLTTIFAIPQFDVLPLSPVVQLFDMSMELQVHALFVGIVASILAQYADESVHLFGEEEHRLLVLSINTQIECVRIMLLDVLQLFQAKLLHCMIFLVVTYCHRLVQLPQFSFALVDEVHAVRRVEIALDEVHESLEVLVERLLEFLVDLSDVNVFIPTEILHDDRQQVDRELLLVND